MAFHFDPRQEAATGAQPPIATWDCVQKTTRRTIVSLRHGRFEARETVRHRAGQAGPLCSRSAALAAVAPPGARHAFDLIAHVGVQTYLHGRRLADLREELASRQPALDVPLSTLWDQQQRFLFYLGALHRQAAPRIRECLAQRGPITWLLDGTLEPETPVFGNRGSRDGNVAGQLEDPQRKRERRGALPAGGRGPLWPAEPGLARPQRHHQWRL